MSSRTGASENVKHEGKASAKSREGGRGGGGARGNEGKRTR